MFYSIPNIYQRLNIYLVHVIYIEMDRYDLMLKTQLDGPTALIDHQIVM